MKTPILKLIVCSVSVLLFLCQCEKPKVTTTTTTTTTTTKDTSALHYGEVFLEQQLFPFSGYMGAKNGSSMVIDLLSTDRPHTGKKSIAISFDGTESWCGSVMFASTPWKDGIGKSYKGYKKLTFWTSCNEAALKNGQIHMGMKFHNSTDFYGQFFNYKTTDWQKFSINIPSSLADNVPVNYIFEFSQNLPVAGSVIYIDDIQYEK